MQNAQKAFLKLSSTAFPRRKYGWWISANGGIVEIWRRQNILRYFPTTGLFFCWFLKVISLCWFPPSFCLSMIRENQFSLNPITQKCLLGTSKRTPCSFRLRLVMGAYNFVCSTIEKLQWFILITRAYQLMVVNMKACGRQHESARTQQNSTII